MILKEAFNKNKIELFYGITSLNFKDQSVFLISILEDFINSTLLFTEIFILFFSIPVVQTISKFVILCKYKLRKLNSKKYVEFLKSKLWNAIT